MASRFLRDASRELCETKPTNVIEHPARRCLTAFADERRHTGSYPRFCPVADKYWNARGGSHTDGGAFVFTLSEQEGRKRLDCTNKFGHPVKVEVAGFRCDLAHPGRTPELTTDVLSWLRQGNANAVFDHVVKHLAGWPAGGLRDFCRRIVEAATLPEAKPTAIEVLTMLLDRHHDAGSKRRSTVLQVVDETLEQLFASCPLCWQPGEGIYRRFDWENRHCIVPPGPNERVMVVDAARFPP